MTQYNGLHKKEDMLGKQFNSWTVLAYSHQNPKSGNWYYAARCVCGKESVVSGTNLRTGQSKQCKSCSSKQNGRKGLYQRPKSDLYFIRCGEYVKIGISDNVPRRMRDLQSSNPYPCELLYHGINEGCDEEFWHTFFIQFHHHGEWYKLSDKQIF